MAAGTIRSTLTTVMRNGIDRYYETAQIFRRLSLRFILKKYRQILNQFTSRIFNHYKLRKIEKLVYENLDVLRSAYHEFHNP